MIRVAPVLFAPMALLMTASIAEAEDEQDAERSMIRALDLWDQGMMALDEGDLSLASGLLTRSYELSPNGRTACTLGRISRQRGHRATASLWLERCATDERLGEEEHAEAISEAAMLSDDFGVVIITGEIPSGAQILVDGELWENRARDAPVELVLPVGSHEIALVDDDGEPLGSVTSVVVRAESPRALDLQPEASRPARQRPSRSRRLRAFWITFALTMALGSGAVATMVLDARQGLGSESSDAEGFAIAAATLGGLTAAGLSATLALALYTFTLRREGNGEHEEHEEHEEQDEARLNSLGWIRSPAAMWTRDIGD